MRKNAKYYDASNENFDASENKISLYADGVVDFIYCTQDNEYVIEYVSRAKDDQIHRLAVYALGLNEKMLRKLLAQHITEDNINEFGRFDALKATVDKARAKAYFEALTGSKLPIPKVNIKVDNLLRDFIFKGGFDIDIPK